MKIVTIAQMQAIERQADMAGLSYSQMMENAGKSLAEVIHAQDLQGKPRRILALVGTGNNGGDALVALKYLADWGWRTSAYLVKPRLNDPLVERVLQAGGEVFAGTDDLDGLILKREIPFNGWLMDGLLGTGAKPPLRIEIASILKTVKTSLDAMEKKPMVIAVDCPSGIDCDTGETPDEVLRADLTVVMAAVKKGLFTFAALEKVGEIRIGDIGNLDGLELWDSIHRTWLHDIWVKNNLPIRSKLAHKGTFGTAMVCAGSISYTGAAWLAGMAAYRIGAGLVTMAVPEPLHAALAGQIPEATWVLLPHEQGWINQNAAKVLLDNIRHSSALLIGPGWGQQAATSDFLQSLLSSNVQNPEIPPCVVDADALKLLARLPNWPSLLPSMSILTPHPGEMSVLTGKTIREINENRLETAEFYARLWGHVVVLKGPYTIIAHPEGYSAVVPVASAALARAGTGDVLAGMITGLRAQGLAAYKAAAAGAYLHAFAGLEAAKKSGAASVMARDVLQSLPEILVSLSLQA